MCVIVVVLIAVLWLVVRRSAPDPVESRMIEILKDNVRQMGIMSEDRLNALDVGVARESYTYAKKHVKLCMKNKSGYYQDRKVLLYVFLHELAHLNTHSYTEGTEHTDEFKAVFKGYINRAISLGLLPENFSVPTDYCKL